MPKKRTYNFKQLQGASTTVPSGKSGSSKDGPGSGKEATSVNERLLELRKIEGSEAAKVKRELAESVNLRTVPPHLRGILGVPESAPPKPKFGARRVGPRVAGPAPPQSWLRARSAGSRLLPIRGQGQRRNKPNAETVNRFRPSQAWRFAGMTSFAPGGESERGPSSLLHLSLRTTAQQWDLVDEADYPALADLDIRLRTRIISYIGQYGPILNAKGFEALIQGRDPIVFLDLVALLGHGTLTTSRLVTCFRPRITNASKEDNVVDSWEQEDSLSEPIPTAGIALSRFSQLTHLCLSHPAPSVSWKHLLSLSKQIPKLTHLSLAHWPRPTLTPNLTTATVSNGHGPDVSAGGSHYYSSHDRDFTEPASLLRQLSSNLLCLQWLDLEGCTAWIPALSFQLKTELAQTMASDDDSTDPWLRNSQATDIFQDYWKNVAYINCFQGWLPTRSGMDALPRQIMRPDERKVVLDFLKSVQDSVDNAENEADHMYETAKRKAQIWAASETDAVVAGSHINTARRAHGLKAILMDHGWRERAF